MRPIRKHRPALDPQRTERSTLTDPVQDERTLSDRFISYLRAELGKPALEFAAPLVRLQGGYETSTCHGDFHPLNVMVDENKVTGILDWGGIARV